MAALPRSPLLARAEVAGAGFVNLFVSDAARQSVVPRILDEGDRYGSSTQGGGEKVIVEFVSANPTGPLHVGHGRGAAVGDAIARLLAAQGFAVHREFYYNDAGAQIMNLALSVQARIREAQGVAASFPDAVVPLVNIVLLARDLLEGSVDPALAALFANRTLTSPHSASASITTIWNRRSTTRGLPTAPCRR